MQICMKMGSLLTHVQTGNTCILFLTRSNGKVKVMTSEDTAALCTTSSNGRSLLSHQYVSSASYVTNVQKAYSTVPA